MTRHQAKTSLCFLMRPVPAMWCYTCQGYARWCRCFISRRTIAVFPITTVHITEYEAFLAFKTLCEFK